MVSFAVIHDAHAGFAIRVGFASAQRIRATNGVGYNISMKCRQQQTCNIAHTVVKANHLHNCKGDGWFEMLLVFSSRQ
jgi:hypothetical protein